MYSKTQYKIAQQPFKLQKSQNVQEQFSSTKATN